MVVVWSRRLSSSTLAACAWLIPAVLAVVMAAVVGVIEPCGVLLLVVLGAACGAAAGAASPALRRGAQVIMLVVAAGLMLHALPGFHNPVVVDGVVLGPGSTPYTKYLNFDKGMAGLLLLAVYLPQLPARDQGARHVGAFAWRFALVTTVVLALSVAAGFVQPQPKAPDWWPLWVWSMVFLTALPEEVVFRGVVQTWLQARLESWPRGDVAAIVIAGVLFGIAHAPGGIVYVGLATVAGLGYGWIYARTRSIAAAILAHSGLNAVHFFLFTYPSVVAATGGV
jgi:membrane protease YdiL (CAAX protease family)